MKSIFFNTEVLEAEKKIITSLNIPSLILMENAGYNSYLYISGFIKRNSIENINILAGKGNNAGDGFVIARHLVSSGIFINVFLFYDDKELKGDALINFEILRNLSKEHKNLKIIFMSNLNVFEKEIRVERSLIIDAVFGVGFKGELDAKIKEAFNIINGLKKKKIIAVDTVSGLSQYNHADGCLEADITLSMGVKKFNSVFWDGRIASGLNEIMSIGIPVSEFDRRNERGIFEIEKSDVKKLIPVRNIHSNKYTNGKLFVLSGSKGFTGAAYLCSLSSLKSGCGAVILGIPESLYSIMGKKLTEVIILPLNETKEKSFSDESYDKIKEKIKWSNTCLIGPGIGRNEETLGLVRKIIRENYINLVLDADGLFAIKDNLLFLKNKKNKIILTPHYGEFANLAGIDINYLKNNFYEIATDFADKYGVILVLKGSPTIVTDGKKFFVNSTGRENLATVGSGDVLAGIIASLYAQSKNAMGSAITGVYIHGLCGDILYNETGSSSTIASELIGKISKAKKEILS